MKNIFIPGTNTPVKIKRFKANTPVIINQRYKKLGSRKGDKVFTVVDADCNKVWLREKIKPIRVKDFKLFYELAK